MTLRNGTLVRSSIQIGSELCRSRARYLGDSDECDSNPLQEVDDGGYSGSVFPSFRPEFAARKVRRDCGDAIYQNFSSHCDRKKQPVIFLPDESTPKCKTPSSKMSAFGYLAFVVSVINAVANAAKNINNNQASRARPSCQIVN